MDGERREKMTEAAAAPQQRRQLCEGSSCSSRGSGLICRRPAEPEPPHRETSELAAAPSCPVVQKELIKCKQLFFFWWVDQRCLISILGASLNKRMKTLTVLISF